MQEPDQMPVINAVKWVIFSKTVNMMVISPLIINRSQDGQPSQDSSDPVVGKWITNLVATTPITAKAMKNLYAELNKQKDLKRTYCKNYKDLQAVVTTEAQRVTLQQPNAVTGTKVKAPPKSLKQTQKE